jgi:hypothetical protein
MLTLDNPQCEVVWDPFQPGRLCYRIGELKLNHQGILSRHQHKAQIPRGQCLIIMRGLMLAYPGYLTHDDIIDRLYPIPDHMPINFMHVARRQVWEINQLTTRLGCFARIKFKLGYRLEFIKQWRA